MASQQNLLKEQLVDQRLPTNSFFSKEIDYMEVDESAANDLEYGKQRQKITSKSNGNMLTPIDPNQYVSLNEPDVLLRFSEEDQDTNNDDPTDLTLDNCFNMLNNAGLSQHNGSTHKLSMMNGGEIIISSPKATHQRIESVPNYELSFNNSQHFLNHLADRQSQYTKKSNDDSSTGKLQKSKSTNLFGLTVPNILDDTPEESSHLNEPLLS